MGLDELVGQHRGSRQSQGSTPVIRPGRNNRRGHHLRQRLVLGRYQRDVGVPGLHGPQDLREHWQQAMPVDGARHRHPVNRHDIAVLLDRGYKPPTELRSELPRLRPSGGSPGRTRQWPPRQSRQRRAGRDSAGRAVGSRVGRTRDHGDAQPLVTRPGNRRRQALPVWAG